MLRLTHRVQDYLGSCTYSHIHTDISYNTDISYIIQYRYRYIIQYRYRYIIQTDIPYNTDTSYNTDISYNTDTDTPYNTNTDRYIIQ